MADLPGTDYQGIALVISSTTALLAIAAPFALRWWEERGRQGRAKKKKLEQHLFFVLDNYAGRRTAIERLAREEYAKLRADDLAGLKTFRERMKEASVPGYDAHLTALRMNCKLYGVDDGGFFDAIERHYSLAVEIDRDRERRVRRSRPSGDRN